MMGGFMDRMLDDAPKDGISDHWLISLAQTPGINRVIGITRYDNERFEIAREVNDEEEIKIMVKNTTFNNLLDGFAIYKNTPEKDVLKFILEQDDEDYERMRAKLDFVKEPMYQELEHRKFWLNFAGAVNTEAKAKIWNRMWERATEKEKAQLRKEWAMVSSIEIINDNVIDEIINQRINESSFKN
jgi:hypothetical protein